MKSLQFRQMAMPLEYQLLSRRHYLANPISESKQRPKSQRLG